MSRPRFVPFAYGFRPFFLAAGLYAVIAVGAWAFILAGGRAPFGALPPHLWHGHIEQHLLGITREQIGSWMMRNWEMQEEIFTALRFQNDPDYAGPHCAYANLVYLAVNLLRGQKIGHGLEQPIPEALYQRLGITAEQAEDALQKVLRAEAALREMASQFQQSRDDEPQE